MIKSRVIILLIAFTCFLVTKAQTVQSTHKATACACDSIDGQQVLSVAEVMPEFPGGTKALYKYTAEKITYKNTCKEEFQTRVIAGFVIDTCGQIRNARIMHPQFSDSLTLLETHVLKIINSMPRWQPGEQTNKKVPVSYMLPINLDPQEN